MQRKMISLIREVVRLRQQDHADDDNQETYLLKSVARTRRSQRDGRSNDRLERGSAVFRVGRPHVTAQWIDREGCVGDDALLFQLPSCRRRLDSATTQPSRWIALGWLTHTRKRHKRVWEQPHDSRRVPLLFLCVSLWLPSCFRVVPLLYTYCSEAHRQENGMHPQGVPLGVRYATNQS